MLQLKKQHGLIIFAILLFFSLRIIYFFQFNQAPYTDAPAVDNQYHHEWAIGIAEGNWSSSVKDVPNSPFFRAPLYPYFVSIVYKISNNSTRSLYWVQAIISFITLLIYLNFLRKIIKHDKNLFILQAIFIILYSLVGSLLYFEFQLLIPTLISFIYSLSFTNFCSYLINKKNKHLLLAALFLGFGAIARPNILIIMPFFISGIFYKEGFKSVRAIQNLILTTILIALPIIPVTIYNYQKSQELTLIATQGGINFYIGNNPYSDGWSAIVPELKVNNWTLNDALQYAEYVQGCNLSSKEHSNFWYKKAIEGILEEPLLWLKLLGKKTYLWHFKEEISNNKSLYFTASQFSPLLNLLLFIGMGLFSPCLFIFIILKKKIIKTYHLHQDSINFILLFYSAYTFSFILFFINSRYRQPMIPLLLLFTAFTIHYIYLFYQNKGIKLVHKIYLSCFFISLFIFFNINIFNLNFNTQAQDFYELGNAYYNLKEYDKALLSYQETAKINPKYPQLQNNLGALYTKQLEYKKAIKAFKNEKYDLKLANKNLESIALYFFKQGKLATLQKKYKRAEKHFKLSLLAKETKQTLFNLGMLYYHLNIIDQAELFLKKSLQLNPNLEQAQVILQKIKMARKK